MMILFMMFYIKTNEMKAEVETREIGRTVFKLLNNSSYYRFSLAAAKF